MATTSFIMTTTEKENMLKTLNKNGCFFAKAKEPVWNWMTPFFSYVTISKRDSSFEIEAKIKKNRQAQAADFGQLEKIHGRYIYLINKSSIEINTYFNTEKPSYIRKYSWEEWQKKEEELAARNSEFPGNFSKVAAVYVIKVIHTLHEEL